MSLQEGESSKGDGVRFALAREDCLYICIHCTLVIYIQDFKAFII